MLYLDILEIKVMFKKLDKEMLEALGGAVVIVAMGYLCYFILYVFG